MATNQWVTDRWTNSGCKGGRAPGGGSGGQSPLKPKSLLHLDIHWEWQICVIFLSICIRFFAHSAYNGGLEAEPPAGVQGAEAEKLFAFGHPFPGREVFRQTSGRED